MIVELSKNSAVASDESISAVNNGSGSQIIDKSTHIHKKPLINLAETATGSIIFDPQLLRDAIIAIDKVFDEPSEKNTDFVAIDVEEKNRINGLTQEYYDHFIATEYEPYFAELDSFFRQRENEDLQILTSNIVASLNRNIFIKRKNFETFEELLLDIENSLLDSQYDALKGKEGSITLFLFYLYANCFIGKKTEGERK